MYKKYRKLLSKEGSFLFVILLLVMIAGFATNHPTLAMWFGFLVAGYSAISNDSVQTLGTFLSSNKKVPWYYLWAFIGGILVITILYGWYSHSGDVSYGRLNKIPQPLDFNFFQLLAPVTLLMLTRLKMPVSTTFLILATFSSSKTISGMIMKTFTGYFLSFFVAGIVWSVVAYLIRKKKTHIEEPPSVKKERLWRTFQWCSTAFLWSVWLMQDNANAVVFLPRALTFLEALSAALLLFFGIGYILYKRGGKIQEIITEKTDVIRVKSATLIDLIYGFILVYFKWINDLPMSTTWVFLGLLAGREIALTRLSGHKQPYQRTLSLVMKDLLRAGIGLGISFILALLASGRINETFTQLFGG